MLLGDIQARLQALRRNALRSILTMLGIVIGVAPLSPWSPSATARRRGGGGLVAAGGNLLSVRPASSGQGAPALRPSPSRPRRRGALEPTSVRCAQAAASLAQSVADCDVRRPRTASRRWSAPTTTTSSRQTGISRRAPVPEGGIRSGRRPASSASTLREELFGADRRRWGAASASRRSPARWSAC